jgi:hypothetical protein
MDRHDMVTVEILYASFQTSQLGEGVQCYRLKRLTENGCLLTARGGTFACHGLLHLLGEDGAEFMAIFTHGGWKASTRS